MGRGGHDTRSLVFVVSLYMIWCSRLCVRVSGVIIAGVEDVLTAVVGSGGDVKDVDAVVRLVVESHHACARRVSAVSLVSSIVYSTGSFCSMCDCHQL